jgi:hypothetical protein
MFTESPPSNGSMRHNINTIFDSLDMIHRPDSRLVWFWWHKLWGLLEKYGVSTLGLQTIVQSEYDKHAMGSYRVFRAQADWTLTHTSHKDTEQSTVEASITLDGVTLTDSLTRWSPNEWLPVYREIPVSADKMFWTSNKPAQWTLYITHIP